MGRIGCKFRQTEDRRERRLLLLYASTTSTARFHVERFYSEQFRLYNLSIHSLSTAENISQKKGDMMGKQRRGPEEKKEREKIPFRN